MTTLDFAEEERGLRFQITDLAGQAVNGVANQFFLVRRAIIAVVWRILPLVSREGGGGAQGLVSEMVSKWLVAVQRRVPGASILLVATHVDCATAEEVQRQCDIIKATVARKVKQYGGDEAATGIPALTVWRGGDSVRVNCLDGTGRAELKKCLVEMAHSLPWWEEGIPRSITLLKGRIEQARLQVGK